MKTIPLILSIPMLLGPTHGAAEPSPSTAPLATGVQRHTSLLEIKADMVENCKKLFAAVPAEVAALYKAAEVRNLSCYLKELEGKTYLFTYLESAGQDYAAEIRRAEAQEPLKAWKNSIAELLVSPGQSLTAGEIEEVFFTAGAATVTPTPEKYSRTGMITGLKPEKEAEYRTLHATTWTSVLKGIADCNYRNFSIGLTAVGDRLYLIGYLEYVGKDPAADAAAGKALPINRRWWKFTDACQQPLPAAAAKGELWDGMTEIYHLD
ncbi:MAG: hypothetical protein RLZZ522_1475 [Verrucomicrobiota bacterium]|jgi:L-rhamnose mutarotase